MTTDAEYLDLIEQGEKDHEASLATLKAQWATEDGIRHAQRAKIMASYEQGAKDRDAVRQKHGGGSLVAKTKAEADAKTAHDAASQQGVNTSPPQYGTNAAAPRMGAQQVGSNLSNLPAPPWGSATLTHQSAVQDQAHSGAEVEARMRGAENAKADDANELASAAQKQAEDAKSSFADDVPPDEPKRPNDVNSMAKVETHMVGHERTEAQAPKAPVQPEALHQAE